MKFLVIGLGNFGSALAIRLTQLGHEVIGVDKRMELVEMHKDDITHTICLDSTDFHAAKKIPVEDTDVVIISIGENEGESIMATAMMKQLKAKRIISRAVSSLQETILKAMEIDEIVHPELDSADRLAGVLNTEGYIDSYKISDNFSIIKARVPERFAGKTLGELNIRQEYKITVLSTITYLEKPGILGLKRKAIEVTDFAHAETVLNKGDIMVIYGHTKDIEKFLG